MLLVLSRLVLLQIVPFIFLMAPLFTGYCEKDPHFAMKKSLRLLTYNVHLCIGVDGNRDYQRVADIISRIGPDAVALQELDSATVRSYGDITLEELSSRTGMHFVYGPYFDYDGGKYGIGILSKEKPFSFRSVPIPGRIENRLLIAEFEDYILCCTHFSGSDEAKLKSAIILNELFREASKPVFFAGDLNAVPGSEVISRIKTQWDMITDPLIPTAPSYNPQNTIDYIFSLKDENYAYIIDTIVVEDEPVASDHCPVWADVTLK